MLQSLRYQLIRANINDDGKEPSQILPKATNNNFGNV